ncbi:hypothetical protein AKJ65_01115 [candidate division MSBL1 archaeon SCGC-AAA259E19]|uniref:2-phospho-L-lactate transferase n=1 Tax=candidate division MSBL1 archaeon SCGC-AAA259E19 TaxID=1698264 RepID=A0A133UN80_9EURY|nr:hypothetical protein AKJ65_01115 [candidate division MSBL1 archaeon SCGC-AAA259E19]
MLTLISGGTGTPKLLQGLAEVVPQKDLSIVVNTGEDVEVTGLRVSPDLDTVVYTLAGIIDDENWYGIKGESFTTHEMLRTLGHSELLRIGDRDRGVMLYRTMRMREGASLSQVTKEICRELRVEADVMPMSDDRITTRVDTEKGEMSFHRFWVARRAKDRVREVKFLNSEKASPAPGVVEALDESEFIIIGPSNPITSLGPVLAVEGIRSALVRNRSGVLAVSPVIGNAPVSGPTGVLMEGLGYEVNPVSVAEIYQDFVSMFFLHEKDRNFSSEIENLEMDVFLEDILMPDLSSRIKLAQRILRTLGYE